MTITAEMTFAEAASAWLDMRDTGTSRARYLKPRTVKSYRLEFAALSMFFGDSRLCDITDENIRKYQQRRSDGRLPFKDQRHPAHVNDELVKWMSAGGLSDPNQGSVLGPDGAR